MTIVNRNFYYNIIVIKKTLGLRVDKEEELKGLDLSEHGMDAYADFRLNQH